jgi:hypothetical protein
MRRTVLVCSMTVLGFLGSGLVISTAGLDAPAGAAIRPVDASKAAFCAANDAIDRATAGASSPANALSLLRSHARDLATMKANAPVGSVGTLARQEVAGADAAIASNNPDGLANLPNSGAIDAYCGVDGQGARLPANFGKGRSTAFCSGYRSVYEAVITAPSEADVLSALTAKQSQLNQLAAGLAKVPKSVRSTATTAIQSAQSIVTTKNSTTLSNNFAVATIKLGFYCGLDD